MHRAQNISSHYGLKGRAYSVPSLIKHVHFLGTGTISSFRSSLRTYESSGYSRKGRKKDRYFRSKMMGSGVRPAWVQFQPRCCWWCVRHSSPSESWPSHCLIINHHARQDPRTIHSPLFSEVLREITLRKGIRPFSASHSCASALGFWPSLQEL